MNSRFSARNAGQQVVSSRARRAIPRAGVVIAATAAAFGLSPRAARAADANVQIELGHHYQTIDGFGTFGPGPKFDKLYFNKMRFSIMRMDLSPHFVAPYSSFAYYSPWFGNPGKLNINDPAGKGGPDHNNVRTYTNAKDYSRGFGGKRAPIAVMGKNLTKDIRFFDYAPVADSGKTAQYGLAMRKKLGGFKLYASIWSPEPWVKIGDGGKAGPAGFPLPTAGTPFPFIWDGNYSGGTVDVSGKKLAVFHNTSALTQFARSTAAYVMGFQRKFHVHFYGISIQNELAFDEVYNSCAYHKASAYVKALTAVRSLFDKHKSLKGIRLVGPEDVLGNDPYGMWSYGSGPGATAKNLKFISAVESQASPALSFFCIHGYAIDGSTAAGASSKIWSWWANGWKKSPSPGLPNVVQGFRSYHKKSWMTETSGESHKWLDPASGFPGNGAWSIAFKMQQALTAGRESACLYWQFAGKPNDAESLVGGTLGAKDPKFIATEHFARFIRPGSVAVAAPVKGNQNVTASAYAQFKNGTLTVELVSRSTKPHTASVMIPPMFRAAKFTEYSSDATHPWVRSSPKLDAARINVSVPAYGVVTLNGQLPAVKKPK